MRVLFYLVIAVSAVNFWTTPSSAQGVLQRDVLALYSGKEEQGLADTRIHRMVEMPLNHLGYRLTYHDIDRGLPAREDLSNVFAVITWFEDTILPADYAQWVEELLKDDKRFVVLGDPDGRSEASPAGEILLSALGLTETGEYVRVAYGLEPQNDASVMTGFEAPLDIVVPPFPVYHAVGDDLEIRFGLKGKIIPGGGTAVLVATSPKGGFAASGFIIRETHHIPRNRWFIDPFKFLSEALGQKSVPIPDTATLAGRRIYFSHIDGDGWNNISEIEAYRDRSVISAEVILREAIQKYPDLPVTVGLIGADVDPEFGGRQDAARVARSLFALPQVEVASHTYTHPYRWRFFENYDRSAELAEMNRRKDEDNTLSVLDRVRYRIYGRPTKSGHTHGGPRKGSNNIEPDPPRAVFQEPFDLAQEIDGSLELAESLAPKGKKAELYLWSGDTNPFEDAIAAVRRAGSLNMNGGDSRFDGQYPSMIYVPPLSRTVGAERQIYAVNSNENTYTNLWTGPYYGYRQLEETIRRTGSPRRLKPVNVYYHMYSGEKSAGLAALVHHLDWARQAQVIPLKASHYVKIANAFFQVTITEIGPSQWRISNHGELRTFRFDDADGIAIDLDRSRGVLGANRYGRALYAALDPIEPHPVIAISKASGTAPPAAISSANRPYLLESRQSLAALRISECSLSAMVDGFGGLDMTWNSLRPGSYQVSLTSPDSGKQLWSETLAATESGRLGIKSSLLIDFPARLTIDCAHEGKRTG